MQIRLGVIMDPIGSIKIHKDSTFAMLLAAQRRGWSLEYMEQSDLGLHHDAPVAAMRRLRVVDDPTGWFRLEARRTEPLDSIDVLLMRKDPPIDVQYFMSTYLLEQAERRGCLVVNRPRSLRDANEKLFALEFPSCCPPSLVTCSDTAIRAFHAEHRDVILKPLDAMGGAGIFRIKADDPNLGVIVESLTAHGTRHIMAQRFIPEIRDGDKRILMIDGTAVPYALARIPAVGETRGNLAAGGKGVAQPLSADDLRIAETVGPELRRRGIWFAGLDVIGSYLTEINVTSPTCIRELDAAYDLDIASDLLDVIEEKLR